MSSLECATACLAARACFAPYARELFGGARDRGKRKEREKETERDREKEKEGGRERERDREKEKEGKRERERD